MGATHDHPLREPEVVIDGAALLHNLRALRALRPGLALFPVIKANAYGHGAVVVAQLLEQASDADSVPYFCVARVREARELRAAGVRRPILVLSEWCAEDLQPNRLPADVALVVNDWEDLRILRQSENSRGALLGVHLNFNTGMNRLGFTADASARGEWSEAIAHLRESQVEVLGFMTHLARGEESPELYSGRQARQFGLALSALRADWKREAWGPFPRWAHVENSGGLAHQAAANLGELVNAARPGLHLWGVEASPALGAGRLRPVMEVRAPVRQIFWVEAGGGVGYGQAYRTSRRTLVGTVALGYADGVDRRLSRRRNEDGVELCELPDLGFVIEGAKLPVLGNVSMDLTMIDLTDHPRRANWEAQLASRRRPQLWAQWIGPRQSAEDIAREMGTIAYEVLCSVRPRLERRLKTGREEVEPA